MRSLIQVISSILFILFYFQSLHLLYLFISKEIYLIKINPSFWSKGPREIMSLLEQTAEDNQDDLQSVRINQIIVNHIYSNEFILLNQYFMIDASDESKNTSQFENLKVIFRTLGKQMEQINNSLKRKTFEQRKFFDFYDCIISPLNFISYTNDERALYEETNQTLFQWEERLKLIELILYRISSVPLIEYKIEEIKTFLDKSTTVYDGLKCMLNNYMV